MRHPTQHPASRVLPAVLAAVVFLQAETPAEIDPARYLDHVRWLASEEMNGRGTGTAELDRAADYIADRFRQAGLEPANGKSYFQLFPVSVNGRLGAGNRLAYESGKERTELRVKQDFVPLSYSGRGKARSTLVFAGYGISAPEYGYDDYEGIDTRGKVVLALRHEPQEFDRKSVFAGKVYTEHAQRYSKAVNAEAHGARALLLVDDTSQHGGQGAGLAEFSPLPGPASSSIPIIHVTADVVREWFKLVDRDWTEIQGRINDNLRPRSFAFPKTLWVSLRTDLRSEARDVRNVAAYLPGETGEYVVIGAHYDHIGRGEQFSMMPARTGELHPGADDNASGTAGLLELARWFAARPPPLRGILFLAFGGEELGLLGSGYYVRHPLRPLAGAVAMLNMDMIGRVRRDKVYIGGVGTGSTFKATLDRLGDGAGLDLDYSETAGYGSSDHTAFTTREVPVLFFFSGLHGDYHRPGDSWDRIDAANSVRLVGFVGRVARSLAEEGARPGFVFGIPRD